MRNRTTLVISESRFEKIVVTRHNVKVEIYVNRGTK